jgi:hypothetical protein
MSAAPSVPPPSMPTPAPKRARRPRRVQLQMVPPPPPLRAHDPDAGLWGPLEDYQYPHYIEHLRRIQDPAVRAELRAKAQQLAPGVLGVVERALEASQQMQRRSGSLLVLWLAWRLVDASGPMADQRRMEFKELPGGPPPPPPDEARRS